MCLFPNFAMFTLPNFFSCLIHLIYLKQGHSLTSFHSLLYPNIISGLSVRLSVFSSSRLDRFLFLFSRSTLHVLCM